MSTSGDCSLIVLGSAAGSVAFGLAAATAWGGSDFVGGLAARRSPALLLTFSGHFVTLLLLLAICAFGGLPVPHRTEFIEGAIGGLEGSLALVAFYRALSMGAMGLTAALTGLLTALVPVLFGLWSEGQPGPMAIGGLLLGGLAIWLIAHAPSRTSSPRIPGPRIPGPRISSQGAPTQALILGAISGAGFGVQLILFKFAARDGVLWALTSARIGGVLGMTAILLFAWPRHTPNEAQISGNRIGTGFWKMGILAGALDTAGNLGYTLAAHTGRLDLAAMVSSLYPGFTILLAALILRERPTGRQTVGMAVALASVVLLSL